MIKLILAGAIVIAMLTVSGLHYKAYGDEIDGCSACYKKNSGKLRLVSSAGKCLKSEKYINLCQPSGSTTGQLECVTGELRYEPTEVANFCQDTYSLAITNPYPTDMNPDDVFEVYCEAPSPYSDDPVFWGLKCDTAKGWKNTGCTGSTYGTAGLDIPQFMNGCFSDDDEYGNANIFTTCCRIAP